MIVSLDCYFTFWFGHCKPFWRGIGKELARHESAPHGEPGIKGVNNRDGQVDLT